ncbi:outer kinetochore KNL1 complex subunit KNL1 [Alosa pseudoharengus]|uniref:outer kinetochore KNL1 complex subunit KNL1 n=1 Tax=Alosa pseudoharengus TaxID=34774 RepID=UPI003F8AAA2A
MESTETFNFDFDRVGPSKRRISSILKAPRTSVKVTEAGLKEPQQGDKSKPTEKRRSSRRVSFAATKNVVVFSKDMTSSSDDQSPSPSLTPTGADCQDAKGIYDGIENLLKAPLQEPHQRKKIQFFSDPVLPDGCDDKTVLFGEDTACMDMTHCHTIIIDKDSDKSDLNFTINTDMSVSRISKPMNTKNAMLQNAEPDFGTFLASVSQQQGAGKNTRNERSYMTRDQTLLFGDDTACMDMTKCHTVLIDNDSGETDLNFSKKAPMSASDIFNTLNKGSNIPQANVGIPKKPDADSDFGLFLASLSKKKGLGNNSKEESCSLVEVSSVPTQKVDSKGFLASLNARRTVIDKENQPPALSYSVSKPQGLHFRTPTTPSTDDFMDLTKSYTVAIDGRGFLQKQQAEQKEKPWAIGRGSANASRLDCDGLIGSLKSPDPDDMDLTKSQTVAINFKRVDLVRSSLSNGRRGEVDPNKTQIFSGDNIGMELTGVINVTAEQENFPAKKTIQTESSFPLSKSRGATILDAPSVSHPHRIHHFQNDHWTVDPANTDDMEMTKSQTVVIDTKGCERKKMDLVRSLSSSVRRSEVDPNKTQIFSGDNVGMELTGVINVTTEEDNFPGKKTLQNESRFPLSKSRGATVLDAPSISHPHRIHHFQDDQWTVDPVNTDDMEMTKSQTVVIDTKSCEREKMDLMRSLSSSVRRGEVDPNKTQIFSGDNIGMELTGVINVTAEHKNFLEKTLQTESRFPHSKSRGATVLDAPPVSHPHKISHFQNDEWTVDPANTDDMEMTKSQTVVIDTKSCERKKMDLMRSLSSSVRRGEVDPNKTQIFSGDNVGMELTGVINVTAEHKNVLEKTLQTESRFPLSKSRGVTVPDAPPVSHPHRIHHFQNDQWTVDPANTDDMEMTKSQTVVIDTKGCERERPSKRRKSLATNRSVMFAQNDEGMEFTKGFTGHIEATECKNSITLMTDASLPSSQASVLQILTACEHAEFTSEKSAVMDLNPSEVSDGCKSSAKKFFPFESLISKPCESEGITADLSFVTGQKNFFPSLGIDDMELTSSKHVSADLQVTTKSMPYMATKSKPQHLSGEGNDMKMKFANLPSDEHNGAPLQEEDPISSCTDKNADSAKPDPVSPPDHTVTKRSDPESQKVKSRRRSLLDLQSKLRRISQNINEPDKSVVDRATLPLPRLEVTEKFFDNTEMVDTVGCRSQTTVEGVSEQMDNVESSKIASLANNETKPLTARLSFGGFLPKLPSRPKPVLTDHVVSETSYTFKSNFLEGGQDATSTNLLDNFEMDDINDEQLPEMSSEEDISVTIDDQSLKQTQWEDNHCSMNSKREDLEDDVFSPTLHVTKSLKRACPEDGHDHVPLEKRKQDVSPSEVTGSAFSSVQWDANATEEASNVMTKTIDATGSSSNSTYLKSEATFESTYKYSQCDSQIDRTLDYEFDFHKKIEDGSITVNEFLRHFGIDFVIHRSRPSALPDNFSPNPTPQLEDLLKETYIYRPKQRIYEVDCGKLTDKVEGLKSRMQQQDHPLKHINESLLQELANLSKEQLLSFGSKLKERKVYFRKKSKMISHEMKTGMYSELVHTTQEAKQKLEEKVLETDTLLKDLDACIHDLEAELAAVDCALSVDQVHVQSDVQPALKKRQEELERLDSAVAEKERQMVDMENEKKKKAEKLERLREEMKDIEKHTSVLHSVNEWKLSLKEDEKTQFSFLHQMLFLEVVHQPYSGMLAPKGEMAQKLCDISFDFRLDAEKSECHTVMVHDLLSQLLKSGKDWLKRYSTTLDIPMLLHEVSLAVSRIRLLGEEIHRLKRWGALRLGVLEIKCADRQVQIVFSSLKAFVKFQLTLAITSAYPFGGVAIQSFQNYIGNTRVDQIEDLVSSIEPAKGYLTKIIKMIHDHILV